MMSHFLKKKSENTNVSIFGVVIHQFSKISHASRKIITEFGYVIRFLKYSVEVVNFDPSCDTTNQQLRQNGPKFIFLKQIELET